MQYHESYNVYIFLNLEPRNQKANHQKIWKNSLQEGNIQALSCFLIFCYFESWD